MRKKKKCHSSCEKGEWRRCGSEAEWISLEDCDSLVNESQSKPAVLSVIHSPKLDVAEINLWPQQQIWAQDLDYAFIF